MDTSKIYKDTEGDDCTIWQMIRKEPDWAANRIQEGEKAIARVAELEADCKAIAKALAEAHRRHNCSLCQPNADANCGKDCEVQHCKCPACIIAGKYREGKP